MVRGPVRGAAAPPQVEVAARLVAAAASEARAVADTRPVVDPAVDPRARARGEPARPVGAAAVPVAVRVVRADSQVVPAAAADPVVRRSGAARSAVAIAPSSNRRRNGSRR